MEWLCLGPGRWRLRCANSPTNHAPPKHSCGVCFDQAAAKGLAGLNTPARPGLVLRPWRDDHRQNQGAILTAGAAATTASASRWEISHGMSSGAATRCSALWRSGSIEPPLSGTRSASQRGHWPLISSRWPCSACSGVPGYGPSQRKRPAKSCSTFLLRTLKRQQGKSRSGWRGLYPAVWEARDSRSSGRSTSPSRCTGSAQNPRPKTHSN